MNCKSMYVNKKKKTKIKLKIPREWFDDITRLNEEQEWARQKKK